MQRLTTVTRLWASKRDLVEMDPGPDDRGDGVDECRSPEEQIDRRDPVVQLHQVPGAAGGPIASPSQLRWLVEEGGARGEDRVDLTRRDELPEVDPAAVR